MTGTSEFHHLPCEAASESLVLDHSTAPRPGDNVLSVDDVDNVSLDSTTPSCSTPLNGSGQSVSISEYSWSPLSDVTQPETNSFCEFSCSGSSPDQANASPHGGESTTSDMFKPYHSGSSVSVCGAICAIMHFCTSARLSYTAIAELLKLLEVLCPSPNDLPKTVYQLKKFFRQYRLEYHLNEYYSECSKAVNECCCGSSCTRTCHIVDVPIEKPLEVIVSSKLQLYFACSVIHFL